MTREETILLSAYTGFMLAPDFGELQKFCEEALGRPVWTHDFADKKIFEDLRAKLRPKVEELIQDIDKPHMPTREQVEKMRGEWIGDNEEKVGTIDGVPVKSATCSVCGNWLVGSDEYDCSGHFCPDCGAPMTDEAVDMILERWKEALDNG